MNNIALYHLEEYLFNAVGPIFRRVGKLSAFDFFCIVIWKANRAKSKVALNLLSHDQGKRQDLETIVCDLTTSLHRANDPEERLRILVMDWGFRLPMATAILTVLWPHEFTIYDVHVCDSLHAYHSLQYKSGFKKLWTGYLRFKAEVEAKTPSSLSLRDKDRHLWGKSFKKQLKSDIKALFSKMT